MRIPLIFLIVIGILLCGCANRVTPTGGEIDTKAPVLLSSSPENSTTNFTSDEIILTFDEYIQLKEINQQLVISPPIQPAPLIEIRKKSIVIETGDSLKPNTTYTVNFGNAIADNNEGNVLPGYRYIFSTGTYLDSLIVSGTIVDALTNKPLDGAIALLYDSTINDSLLLNKSPEYFGRTDVAGQFTIPNIRPGTYKIFALSEKNYNYIYDQPDELAGFASDIFTLKDSAEFELRVYKPLPVKQIIKSGIIREPGIIVTVFSKPARALTWEFQGVKFDKVIPEYNTAGDSVSLYVFPPVKDTVSVVWFENDVSLDTINYTKSRSQNTFNTASPKSTGYSFFPAKNNMLTPETSPSVTWWAPIEKSDFSKIIFLKDSVSFPVSILFSDSLNTTITMNSEWKEGNYTVTILPGAVTDVYGFSNDTVSTSFSVPPEKTKGSISYNFTLSEAGSHLLQLVNEKHELIRQRNFDQHATGVFELVDPGTYMLRVITDNNNNSKWDGGDFRNGILPEAVVYHPESILVRSNWEVELEWVK